MSRATTPTEPDLVLIAPDREDARRIYLASERVLEVIRARILNGEPRIAYFDLFAILPTLPFEDVEGAVLLLQAERLVHLLLQRETPGEIDVGRGPTRRGRQKRLTVQMSAKGLALIAVRAAREGDASSPVNESTEGAEEALSC